MRYNNIALGEFVDRPNRFIAHVLLGGELLTVHVKNTGRCRELLKAGCQVYLCESNNMSRKTRFDLVAVCKEYDDGRCEIVNIDSQMPNEVAYEWLSGGNLFSSSAVIKREVTFGKSRFDLYVEDGDRRAFIEVKGVTLEKDGIAMFPDAPTERGIKHIKELISAASLGYEAYIMFVIQMKGVRLFKPNFETHRAFGEVISEAKKAGVNILAYDCIVEPDSLEIDSPIKVETEEI